MRRTSPKKYDLRDAGHISLAGALGIEPRSKVLETFILTVVLCPYSYLHSITDV